jgi:hypothetical protein
VLQKLNLVTYKFIYILQLITIVYSVTDKSVTFGSSLFCILPCSLQRSAAHLAEAGGKPVLSVRYEFDFMHI